MELPPLVSVLSALAQMTRLRCYLILREGGEKTAGELATVLGVPANTMSSHLTILGTAGLVTSTRKGRNIIYRAEASKVVELAEFLDQLSASEGSKDHDANT
jgi:DNA-binding transcriptional ArsR family regulator